MAKVATSYRPEKEKEIPEPDGGDRTSGRALDYKIIEVSIRWRAVCFFVGVFFCLSS